MLRPVYFTWIGIWHGHQSHNGKISFLDSREPLADLFLPWGAADPQEPFKFMSFVCNDFVRRVPLLFFLCRSNWYA